MEATIEKTQVLADGLVAFCWEHRRAYDTNAGILADGLDPRRDAKRVARAFAVLTEDPQSTSTIAYALGDVEMNRSLALGPLSVLDYHDLVARDLDERTGTYFWSRRPAGEEEEALRLLGRVDRCALLLGTAPRWGEGS